MVMATKTRVPTHGNYHGYYNKRPATNDPRLGLVPRGLFVGARVLDVGCNEGLVTCEIAQNLHAKRVIGVDIDDTLVSAAWKHRRSVWSQQGPTHREDTQEDVRESSTSDSRKRRRISNSDTEAALSSQGGLANYFPVSFEHMFGPLPIPASGANKDVADIFPHNVTFRTADWVKEGIPEDAEGYDVIVAFSISKWIHLNGGDESLRTFFRRVHEVLNPGGTFVLEPQGWDTYGKAKRMDSRLKENARHLLLRPDDFGRVLQEIGFGPAEHLGEAGEGGFRRPIDIYRKMQ
ncbi:Bin3-domain-containing protein [Dichomitus squalens]|uniref:RNA methyltransferase n=1 Tax=Dichomitus squalens TaxID=114155 RepID=A0A4Q9P3R9_9APHY|nr:Bin3-domain-containing protein [Dichomitus squalens]TBU64111.1 Bin3-domain-containing protein [Dichomitus squalens]